MLVRSIGDLLMVCSEKSWSFENQERRGLCACDTTIVQSNIKELIYIHLLCVEIRDTATPYKYSSILFWMLCIIQGNGFK